MNSTLYLNLILTILLIEPLAAYLLLIISHVRDIIDLIIKDEGTLYTASPVIAAASLSVPVSKSA